MRFEEREQRSYAEPVAATELKEGSVYFSVTFVDANMYIPVMETLAFVGTTKDNLLLFQNIESYRQGMRYDAVAPGCRATFFQCAADQLNAVFEYEHALDLLLKCSLRRRSAGLST